MIFVPRALAVLAAAALLAAVVAAVRVPPPPPPVVELALPPAAVPAPPPAQQALPAMLDSLQDAVVLPAGLAAPAGPARLALARPTRRPSQETPPEEQAQASRATPAPAPRRTQPVAPVAPPISPPPSTVVQRGSAEADPAVAEGIAAYRAGDYARAWTIWLPLAERGDARAQFHIGAMLLEGRLGAPHPAAAARWLLRALDGGYAPARALLETSQRTGLDPAR